nr:glycosyltransferase family 2 protein [uncultured Desulfobacter sp.]
MKDKIAVIVLNYFRCDLCKSCVTSVIEELPSVVFLIDNSADARERIKLENEFKAASNVRLFFPKSNLGFAGGVNLGLKQAVSSGHSRFFLLNNDAVLEKGSYSIIDKALIRHPGTLLSPGIVWERSRCDYHYYHKFLGLMTRNKPRSAKGWIPYFTGCALIFDLEVLRKTGYLDPTFFMYGEDVAFCYIAAGNNILLRTVPEELIRHEGSSSTKMASFFYEYYINRSHFLLSFRLNNSMGGIIAALILKTLPLSVRALMRSFRYKTLSPIKGFVLAPLNLPVRPSRKGKLSSCGLRVK